VGFLVGFIVVFQVGFQKNWCFFGWIQLHQYILNFWAKFQNCPNNCLIWLYDASLISRFVFVLTQSHTCVCNMCFVSSFVI